jgi:hypothetical protein
MDTAAIRKQLHHYLDVADDRKIEAIYTIVENEINEALCDYSPEFKVELDERVNYYLNKGKMVSPFEMNKRIQILRKKRK